jgi:hypothetical protein
MIVFRRRQPFNQADFVEIPVSYFECTNDRYAFAECALSWPRMVEYWAAEATVVRRSKSGASLISPCHFCVGRRIHADAINAGMVMLDSDGGIAIDAMAAIFTGIGVAAAIYTSARNRPCEPRIRLMVPLERLVSPSRYGEVIRALVRVINSQLPNPDGWKIDKTKFHCGDLYYVPGAYQIATSDDGEVFIPINDFRSLDGEIWDGGTWIGLADALSPEPVKATQQRPTSQEIRFDRRSKWSPETQCGEKIGNYLSLSDGRQAGLFGLMSSIACSAFYWRYDLSDGELAGIADDIQRLNPPRRPYPYRKLRENAARVIREAPGFVGRQEPYPESRDTLAEQLAAIAATRIETDDSCARLDAFIGGSDQ